MSTMGMPVARPRSRFRITLHGGMIAIALVALGLGLVLEQRRFASDRHGPGHERARKVFAMRGKAQGVGGHGMNDPTVVLGVAAVAQLSSQLRRRWLR
jgi:hypothetical protein